MNKVAVKNKLQKLEAEIGLLKQAVVDRPDFDIDEVNWLKVKKTVKKTRQKVYKQVYG